MEREPTVNSVKNSGERILSADRLGDARRRSHITILLGN